jgi:hypothetical protein
VKYFLIGNILIVINLELYLDASLFIELKKIEKKKLDKFTKVNLNRTSFVSELLDFKRFSNESH